MARLLDSINSPADLKKAIHHGTHHAGTGNPPRLIDTVSITGGHLASSLGAVELTIALHRVFNTPDDKLVWDVGHRILCPQAAHRQAPAV